MSRYRWRGHSVGAAPSPVMVGEMEVIVGEVCFAMSVDAFFACFALDEEAVATESPAAVAETAVVVTALLAPVPELPTSVHWSTVAPVPPPRMLPAIRKETNRHPHGPFSAPWRCETCEQDVNGRKCPTDGTMNPKLLAARPAMRIHRPAAERRA